MKSLYVVIIASMFLLGCAADPASPWVKKYPPGSVVENKLGVKGVVRSNFEQSISIDYVDAHGVMHYDHWKYIQLKDE